MGSNLDLSFSSMSWQSTDKEYLSWLPVLLITIVTHTIEWSPRHCARCFLQIISWKIASPQCGHEKHSHFWDLEIETQGFIIRAEWLRKGWSLVLHPIGCGMSRTLFPLSSSTSSLPQQGSLGSDRETFKIGNSLFLSFQLSEKSNKSDIVGFFPPYNDSHFHISISHSSLWSCCLTKWT